MSNRRPPGDDQFPDLVPDLAPAPAPRRAPPPVEAPAPLPLIEEPAKADTPSAPPGPIDFGDSIDLDMPGRPNAPAPAPMAAPKPGAPKQQQLAASEYKTNAQKVMEAMTQGPLGGPAPRGGANAEVPLATDYAGPEPGSAKLTKEQVQEAARKAAAQAAVIGREIGREVAVRGKVVAEKTRDVAVAAAIRSIGGNQEKAIRIEDPATWLKPMMGPLIALGLAVLISIILVIAGVTARWITIPLLLGAIGFGIVRWIRLQAEQ